MPLPDGVDLIYVDWRDELLLVLPDERDIGSHFAYVAAPEGTLPRDMAPDELRGGQ